VDRSLALVLDYPDGDRAATAASLPPRLEAFGRWWAGRDIGVVRARYVADFDLGGRAALHLTYHRFGDRRERGRALVALKRLLREAGWELAHWELPDYLPLLVELAAVDPAVGLPLLDEYAVEANVIRKALDETGSPWADVLRAVCAELAPVDDDAVAALYDEGPPTELVGLEGARA
jgi:nitrate reductase delta subunit